MGSGVNIPASGGGGSGPATENLDMNGFDIVDAGTVTADVLAAQDQGKIHLFEGTGGGSNKVIIQAPATLAADYTLTLPADDGSANQILSTNGSGTLSWVTNGTTPSFQRVTTGGIQNFTLNSLVDITGLSINVTTTRTNEVVLLTLDLNVQFVSGATSYCHAHYKIGSEASVEFMQWYNTPTSVYDRKSSTAPITITGAPGTYTVKAQFITAAGGVDIATQANSSMSIMQFS